MFDHIETELLVRVITLEHDREVWNSARASEARGRHRSPLAGVRALIRDSVRRPHKQGRKRLGRGGQTC